MEENLKKNMIVGIGSGSTVVYAVKKIADMNKAKNFNLKCVPTSFQARQLIIENGLTLASLDQCQEIDLDFDGADEIDKNLNLIKGGGGCLVQEKIVASNSKELIIVADFRKVSKKLGENWRNGVPIEVIPMAYASIMKRIAKIGGNPTLRMGKAKIGPVITDNGNFLIDADFGTIENPVDIDKQLLEISGIVDTGFFIGMASKVYIGQKDGTVVVFKK